MFFRIAISRTILIAYRDVIAVSAVFALLFVVAQAHAGEIEPRAYVNTPVGINCLLTGYAYSDCGLSTDASSPAKDAQLEITQASWLMHGHWMCGADQGRSM